MIALLLVALALGPADAVRDTTFQVREGDRLVLEGFRGELEVTGWDGEEMRVEARGRDEDLIFRLDRRGNALSLNVLDPKGRDRDAELRIRLPSWMELEVRGRGFDADVRGLDGSVVLNTLDGDLTLHGLSGPVRATSSDGEIDARELSGSVELSTGDGEVTLRDCSGSLTVFSVDGEVTMTDMRALNIEARSTEGDLSFSGELLSGGDYAFHTHNGEIWIGLDPPVNLSATVLAYDGEFEAGFPIRTQGFESGKSIEFTVGDGSARLVLEAFNGDITLVPRGRN